MTEDNVTPEEIERGEATLPENTLLTWAKDSDGFRRYSIDNEEIYVAKHHSFAIAAAVAIEETLSYEEKRIFGRDN